jgi:Gpi18-like mannosyltransferase
MQTGLENSAWRTADSAFFYCVAVGWPAAGLLVAVYFLWAKQPLRASLCLGLGVLSIALRTFVL